MDINSIRKLFRSRTRSRRAPIIAAALIVGAALDASAAEYTIDTTIGRDLAVPANWGATSLTAADTGIIAKRGRYNLSTDLTLNQLKIAVDDDGGGIATEITNFNHTVFLSANNHPLDIYTKKSNVSLRGGVWDFGGVQNFRGQKAAGVFFLYDGARITNVTNFYSCYYAANNCDMRLYGGSIVSCTNFYFACKNTTSARLIVQGGSRIETTGSFYSDANNGEAGANGVKSYNRMTVNGEGSIVDASKAFVLGNDTSVHILEITNGAVVRAGGNFTFGNNVNRTISSTQYRFTSSTNSISMFNGELSVGGTFAVGGLSILNAQSSGNTLTARNSTINVGAVTNNATRTSFTIGDGTVMTVGGAFNMAGTGGKVTVAGGKVSCGGAFELKNDNALRFELPAAGYAAGEAAVTADNFVFDATASLELDYSSGCKRATLISLASKPAASGGKAFREWVEEQAAGMNLPQGRTIMVLDEGAGCQVVYGAPQATVVSFR